MDNKQTVLVSAVVHAKAEYNFHFEFDGDTSDEDAMKDAAWSALNSEAMIGPLECLSHEFVDEEQYNTAMTLEVVDGSPDDYRPAPKTPSKAKLWRRVARLAGEVIMRNDPALCTYGPSMNVLSGASAVRELIRVVHEFEAQGLATTRKKLLSRLEAALKEWEAAQ
jgi:hypothetical protein